MSANVKRRGPRGKGRWIDTLAPDVRLCYERDVLGNPRTTAEAARQWLAARGVKVSLASVLRHRNWFTRARRRLARAAAVEAATAAMARELELGPEDLAAGDRLRVEHLLFIRAYKTLLRVYRRLEPADPEQIARLARSLRLLIEYGR